MAEEAGDLTPTPSVTSNEVPANKRRRTSQNPSSRGVANLTPEQLARKRANDREAQRAIRERTKNQIDRLNGRIRELESQQPYHELQVVLRAKEAVERENEDIRKRLASVMSLIQPVLRAQGLNDLAAAAERSPLPIPPPPESGPQSAHHLGAREYQHNHAHAQNGLTHADDVQSAQSPGAQSSSSRPWAYPGDPPTSNVRGWPGAIPPYDEERHSISQEMGYAHCDERLGVEFLLDGSQRMKLGNAASLPQHSPPGPMIAGHSDHAMIAHSTLPRNIGPTCPLDVLMLDFLAERRQRAAEGTPIKTLVGPLYPNFTSLVYPDRQIDAHPLSKLFTDILRTFPDISGLPEQVAVVFIMFLVMRWKIEPTQENYDRLPEWVTPRPSQLFTPHPCWMDNLPWPRLRDRITAIEPFTVFDSFFVSYTTTISLNWPYEARDCLLPVSAVKASSTSSQFSSASPYSTTAHAGSPPGPPTPGGAVSTPGAGSTKDNDHWLINPAFESHLRNLNNWSLGPAFRTAFPHFGDYVRIKEGR